MFAVSSPRNCATLAYQNGSHLAERWRHRGDNGAQVQRTFLDDHNHGCHYPLYTRSSRNVSAPAGFADGVRNWEARAALPDMC